MSLPGSERLGEELSGLSGWSREGDVIVKRFELADFVSAIGFVRRIAERAEAAGHRPDIAISYNVVTLTLSSDSEVGTTQEDIERAAASFDEAAEA